MKFFFKICYLLQLDHDKKAQMLLRPMKKKWLPFVVEVRYRKKDASRSSRSITKKVYRIIAKVEQDV